MNRKLARTAIGCLQWPPDENALTRLSRLNERESCLLLKWLDEGGLSLYLLNHLRSFGALQKIPHLLMEEITVRLDANEARNKAMFSEFARVNNVLQAAGANFTFLKGFTVTPLFCPSIYLRHQIDIDVLISPGSVACARQALSRAGYTLELEHPSGELRFVTSISESRRQDHEIYGMPRFSRVEVHQSLWEDRDCISLHLPGGLFRNIEERCVLDVTFPALRPAPMFLLHTVHAFRHFLSSWIRQSWLYEISYSLNTNFTNDELWGEFTEAASDPHTSIACGLILSLCSQAFGVQLPDILTRKIVGRLPDPIREWVRICGERWTLSDMRGSKVNLMLREFFSVRGEFQEKHPILPPILGAIRKQLTRSEGDTIGVIKYHFKRFWFHASVISEYLWFAYRWRLSLSTKTQN